MNIYRRLAAEIAILFFGPSKTELTQALKDARAALDEAADKFWVFYCNAPTFASDKSLWATHRREDKDFMAEKSREMTVASIAISTLIGYRKSGEYR